jgi:hypothetical protein
MWFHMSDDTVAFDVFNSLKERSDNFGHRLVRKKEPQFFFSFFLYSSGRDASFPKACAFLPSDYFIILIEKQMNIEWEQMEIDPFR